ncbi:MAG: hypothetical protein ACI4A3_14100 [Lachnospiraceae bacterium]
MIKRFVLCFAVVILLAIAISGCVPPEYSSATSKQVVSDAKEMINTYLTENFGKDTSHNYSMLEAGLCMDEDGYDTGRNASYVARADFTVDGENYVIYADTEQGDIYTNYYFSVIEDAFSDIITDEFAAEGLACNLKVSDFSYTNEIQTDVIASKENGTVSTVTTFSDAVISTVTPQNAQQFIRDAIDSADSDVRVTVAFYGEGNYISEGAAVSIFDKNPGLYYVEAYNYAEVDMLDYIATGELRLCADLRFTEYYRIGRGFYRYDQYEQIEDGNVGLNAVVYSYSHDFETGEISETEYRPSISADRDHIIIDAVDFFNYLYFTDISDYEGRVITQYDDILDYTTEYDFKDCGDGYYTLAYDVFERTFPVIGSEEFSVEDRQGIRDLFIFQ